MRIMIDISVMDVAIEAGVGGEIVSSVSVVEAVFNLLGRISPSKGSHNT